MSLRPGDLVNPNPSSPFGRDLAPRLLYARVDSMAQIPEDIATAITRGIAQGLQMCGINVASGYEIERRYTVCVCVCACVPTLMGW